MRWEPEGGILAEESWTRIQEEGTQKGSGGTSREPWRDIQEPSGATKDLPGATRTTGQGGRGVHPGPLSGRAPLRTFLRFEKHMGLLRSVGNGHFKCIFHHLITRCKRATRNPAPPTSDGKIRVSELRPETNLDRFSSRNGAKKVLHVG